MSKLDILRQLRQMKQLSQTKAAEYFGLAQSGYQTVGQWERGEEHPALKHRARFISYLLNELGLRDNPTYFIQVWKILAAAWGWPDVTEPELAAYKLPKDSLSNVYGYLLINDSPMNQNIFCLKQESITIGRLYGCDIVVPIEYNRVSKMHALILYNNGKVYIKDANSKLGTFVNGVRIEGEYLLEHGQEVTLGASRAHETVFRFVFLIDMDIESTASAL